MSEFRESGDYYTSKSGNDANPGTDPALPKLSAFIAHNSVSIIGTGLYNNVNLKWNETGNPIDLIGDGQVTLMQGTTDLCLRLWTWGVIKNLKIINSALAISDRSSGSIIRRENIHINGGRIWVNMKSGNNPNHSWWIDSTFININSDSLFWTSNTNYCYVRRCLFLNDSARDMRFNTSGNSTTQIFEVSSCYFDQNTNIVIDQVSTMKIVFKNCNIRGSVTFGYPTGITYVDLAAAEAALPDNFENCFNSDPQWLGDPAKLETIVPISSPMIGTGYNGENVGGAKIGKLLNENYNGFGTNPQVNNNTAYVSGALTLVSGVSGNRESASIDLGQERTRIRLRINSFIDQPVLAPDANDTLTNPGHNTVLVQWAGNDGVFNGTWQLHRWDDYLQVDSMGRYTGDANFGDGGATITYLSGIRYLKIDFHLKANQTES